MFSMFLQVEYTGFVTMFESTVGRSLGKRALGNMLAHANRQTIMHWHRKFLPLRFTAEQRRYNNQRRKQNYSRIKRELAQGGVAYNNGYRITEKRPVQRSGVIDNVRKGETERQARQSPAVFASRTRATLTMFVPRYAAIQPRDPAKPSTSREMTKVAPQEFPELRRVFYRAFIAQLKFQRNKILKRI